jgi:hypothetical protein
MKIVVPQDLSLPPIPPGVYKASVTGYKIKTSAETGNPYVQWEFTLLSQGPTAEIKTVGRKVFDNTTFTEESLWKLASLLEAVGEKLEPGEFELEDLVNFTTSRVLNKELVLRVEVETYQGQVRTRVKEYKPAQG